MVVVVKTLKFRLIALLVATMLAAFTAAPARAGEGYTYGGDQGFRTEFFLIGGQYLFYVDAHLPPAWAISGLHDSCTFIGNFQRVWPTHETMQLGAPVRKDPVSRADQLYADVQWGSDAAKHLGTSTVVFIAKIGSSELASSGSFTLTP
jgi:hypothetical protein